MSITSFWDMAQDSLHYYPISFYAPPINASSPIMFCGSLRILLTYMYRYLCMLIISQIRVEKNQLVTGWSTHLSSFRFVNGQVYYCSGRHECFLCTEMLRLQLTDFVGNCWIYFSAARHWNIYLMLPKSHSQNRLQRGFSDHHTRGKSASFSSQFGRFRTVACV